MNQIADILRLADKAQQQKIDAVLATVVRTEGSAYRRAGAMMLILEDGCSVGMISGGCLEPHIIKRAFWLTRSGANVQVYQTGDDIEYTDNGEAKRVSEDSLRSESDLVQSDIDDDLYYEMDELNFGLGCNGRVHVLFERLTTAMPLLESIRQVRKTQQPLTIATLIRSNTSNNQDKQDHQHNFQYKAGTRLNIDAYSSSGQITMLDASSEANQAFLDSLSTLVSTAETLAEPHLDDKNTKYLFIENNERSTEWLIQRLQPQIRLLICGAGDDVMPLVSMAKLQDWHVTVIDSRLKYATRIRFPQADTVMPLALDDSETLLALSKNAAVALMSHSLTQDRMRLATLLEHADHYQYLGQLGPRYRTERLINEISVTKTDPAVLDAGIKKLHYPIGFKLGGDGPEALALGIMAQINAVMYAQNTASGLTTLGLSNSDAMSNDLTLSHA